MKWFGVDVRQMLFMLLLQPLLITGCYAVDTVSAGGWQSPLLREHPLVGKIVDLQRGETISRNELVNRLKDSRFVLIGEKHDNPDHHVLEGWLLNALLSGMSGHTKPAVVFEMLDDSQQAMVDKLSADDSLDKMQHTLHWQQNGWDWKSYGPLFKQTLMLGAELVPGNVSKEQLQTVYKSGKSVLDPVRFHSMEAISRDQQAAMQQQIYESHCEMVPLDSLSPMVSMQIAKDASLAHAMVEHADGKAVLIAGGFHASKAMGVPQHLKLLAPDARVSVVMLMEVSEDAQLAEDYISSEMEEADYIWFTPKATDKDYCESLRKHKAMNKNQR